MWITVGWLFPEDAPYCGDKRPTYSDVLGQGLVSKVGVTVLMRNLHFNHAMTVDFLTRKKQNTATGAKRP
jgi:hypothetical protein